MFFPFTFALNVAGLTNPFALRSATAGTQQEHRAFNVPSDSSQSQSLPGSTSRAFLQVQPTAFTSPRHRRISRADLPKINRPRPSPSPSPAPVSRKRGWEPTFAEPSKSATTLASSNGYLDTPARYREMAMEAQNDGYYTGRDDVDFTTDDNEDMPPMKKRRGLAGSIVSTAVSAALIGTAVGLTVYRLWRDRGKEEQARIMAGPSEPEALPPPYEPPPEQWKQSATARAVHHTLRSPKKGRSTKKPNTLGRRSRKGLPTAVSPRPELDFGHEDEGDSTDKMDWIGDKLSMLIEQGKRALNAEVVVMSDSKEDEIDDGTGVWEEELDDGYASSASRPSSGSMRRSKRPKALNLGSRAARSCTSSTGFPSSSLPSPRRSAQRGVSPAGAFILSSSAFEPSQYGTSLPYLSPQLTGDVMKEDAAGWESPELRESMERARARMMTRRTGGSV